MRNLYQVALPCSDKPSFLESQFNLKRQWEIFNKFRCKLYTCTSNGPGSSYTVLSFFRIDSLHQSGVRYFKCVCMCLFHVVACILSWKYYHVILDSGSCKCNTRLLGYCADFESQMYVWTCIVDFDL